MIIDLQELKEVPDHCPKCGGNTETTEKPMIPQEKGG